MYQLYITLNEKLTSFQLCKNRPNQDPIIMRKTTTHTLQPNPKIMNSPLRDGEYELGYAPSHTYMRKKMIITAKNVLIIVCYSFMCLLQLFIH